MAFQFLLALVPILFVILLAVVISLPVYFALRIIGEPRSILRSILATFIGGFVYVLTLPFSFFGMFGTVLAFLALLLSYKIVLRIGWIQSLLVWALSIVLVALFWFLIFLIPGLSLAMFGI